MSFFNQEVNFLNASSQRRSSALSLIDQTLIGRSIVQPVNECLLMAATILLSEKELLRQSTNYLAEAMRTRLKVLMEEGLQPLSYVREIEANQCRLLCPGNGREPIRLRWGLGRVHKGTGFATLNSRKGYQTIKGVNQNAEHFRPQGFAFARRAPVTPKEANLWLLYEFDVRNEFLSAWLVLPDNIMGGRRFRFLDAQEILSQSLSGGTPFTKPSDTPKFEPKNDDTDIPFGLKAG